MVRNKEGALEPNASSDATGLNDCLEAVPRPRVRATERVPLVDDQQTLLLRNTKHGAISE